MFSLHVQLGRTALGLLPTGCIFGLVAADLSFAFYQHRASLWYPRRRFFLSLLLFPAAHRLGQVAKNGKFFFAASSDELGKKLNGSCPLSCPHFLSHDFIQGIFQSELTANVEG